MPVIRHRLLSIFFVGCLFSIVACGAGLTTEEHLVKAKDYIDKDEFQAALIELKNVLQKTPDNVEARWLLGQIYLEQGAVANAEKELRKAVEFGLAPEAAEVLLTRALILQGEYQQVIDSAVKPESLPEPDRAELLALRANAYLMVGEPDKAEELYDVALSIQAGNPEAETGKAQLAVARNDLDEARKRLAVVLETTPDFAPALSQLGLIEFWEGNLEQAEEAYTKAMQDPIYKDRSQYKRALLRIRLAKFEQAAEDISALRRRIQTHPNLDYAEGLLHFEQRQFDEAQVFFDTALGANPRHASALFYAGATHAFLGNPASARDYLRRYLALNPGNLPAQRLLAQVELQTGNPAEAQKLALGILEEAPDNVMTMNLLADALSQIGNHDAAVDVMRRVVAAEPESTDAQMRLGEALLKEGEVDEGLRNIQEMLGDDAKSHKAVEIIIRQHIKRGELDKALEVASEFRDRQPDSAPAHVLLGVVRLSRNEMLEASQEFKQALEIEPGLVPAYHGMAMLAIKVNDLDRAESYYRESLKNKPGDYVTMMNLVKLEIMQGDRAEATSLLGEVIELHPEKLQPRLELGRNHLRAGELEKAINTLHKAQSLDPDNKILLGLLVEAQLADGRYKDAKLTLSQLDKLAPDHPQLTFALAEVYQGLGDEEQMRAELERTASLDPNFVPAQFSLARLAIADKNTDDARKRVENLRTLVKSDNANLLQLEVQLAVLTDDMPTAISTQQELFNLQQTNANLRQLVLLQWNTGLKDDAVQQYEQWVREHPKDTQAQLELAQRYLDLERTGDAIATYKSVLEIDTENGLALNNLASLLNVSDAEAALGYAERAYTLYPEDPAVMDTLAGALLASGHTKRAARMNERSLARLPDNPAFLQRRAQILEAQSQRD